MPVYDMTRYSLLHLCKDRVIQVSNNFSKFHRFICSNANKCTFACKPLPKPLSVLSACKIGLIVSDWLYDRRKAVTISKATFKWLTNKVLETTINVIIIWKWDVLWDKRKHTLYGVCTKHCTSLTKVHVHFVAVYSCYLVDNFAELWAWTLSSLILVFMLFIRSRYSTQFASVSLYSTVVFGLVDKLREMNKKIGPTEDELFMMRNNSRHYPRIKRNQTTKAATTTTMNKPEKCCFIGRKCNFAEKKSKKTWSKNQETV